jgi:hypothetical protein
MESLWTRRGLFMAGGQMITGITLAAALDRYAQAQSSDAVDWRRLFSSKPEGGTGVVKQVTGIAFANQRTLKVGSTVKSGEQLRVAKGGTLAISIQDGTLISMREETVLDFAPSAHKTGLLNLIAGSLLTVMPTGNRYLVAGPTATIGIKGTVIYRQVFPENVHSAQAMEGRTAKLPGKGLKDYFCTCNGTVDYLHNSDKSLIVTDHAEHHNSFFLNPGNSKLLEKFEMVNHFDRDIMAAINLQDGPKHDTKFLKL